MTEPMATFSRECDVAASADTLRICLRNPTLLARCVPGASLTASDDGALTGRIRIKQSAVPRTYALEAELGPAVNHSGDQGSGMVVAFTGVAQEQRTGSLFEFSLRLGVTATGPDRSRCRITAELPVGDDTGALLTRLTPQFIRRLEDVALELPDMNEVERPLPARQEHDASPAQTPVPGRRVNGAMAGAAAAGVASAGALLAWRELRRRRSAGATW